MSESAWQLLDDEARQRLPVALGARKLIDFSGPHGWDFSAVDLGRASEAANGPVAGVTAAARRTLPVIELRAPFTVARAELDAHERGAIDPDLASLDAAAAQIAEAENSTVFLGWSELDLTGICDASPHPSVASDSVGARYPQRVAKAVATLLQSGIDGPYGLALGPADYTEVIESSEHGGYPLLDHLRKILGGPIVWVPGLAGGVVLSMRGGDFLFDSGEDLVIGYDHHDDQNVHLYLEESFAFRVATPEAAVALTAA
jgi:uncharacterized linocin/CFP29 family protein